MENQLDRNKAYQDDEIDLKELLFVIWKGKWTVVLSTLVVAAIAIAYALLAKQVWTTEATVTAPQISDFSEYQRMVRGYQPIFNVYQDNGTVLVSKRLDDLVKPNTLFLAFVQNFNSLSNKRAFLENYEPFKLDLSAFEAKNNGALDKRESAQFYSQWYKKLSSKFVKGRSENDFSYSLNGQAETSDTSYQFFLAYVAFVEKKANAILMNNLESMVQSKQNELSNQNAILLDQARNQLNVEKERAGYALQIAKAESIDKPVQNLGDSKEIFAINIGANALQAKVRALDSLKNLSIIDPKLDQIQSKLKLLQSMKLDKNIHFHSFQYITSPESPLSRTSPKRPLIAILGVLLGGILGVAIVLIRHAFKEKN